MKRLSFLLCCLALTLALGAAVAQDAFVGFALPEGAQSVSPAQVGALEAPKGLEPMYALMGEANAQSETIVFRMKNGRALLSASRSVKGATYSASGLKAAWPAIAAGLGAQTRYLDASADCATLGARYGYDTLEIATTAVVGEDESLKLSLRCTAFCRGAELIELWSAYPADGSYLFNDAAYEERASDLADLEALKGGLDFGTASVSLELPSAAQGADVATEQYTDPDGRFEVALPTGCRVLTAQSDASEAEKLRAELIAAFGDGAGTLFDVNYGDVVKENATLVTTSDLSASAMIYRVFVKDFQKATYKDLMRLWESTEKSLAGKFGSAKCLQSEGSAPIAGQPHAWTSYWLRTQQTDVLFNLFSCVDTAGWLREVDVFAMMDAPDAEAQGQLLHALINSMRYMIPAE